jgi:low temperature requirement protein LtrA
VNAKDALDSRDSAGFAAAYAAMRFVLVAQYLRASRVVGSRPLSTVYLTGSGIAALFWLTSALLPAPPRFALWAVAFAIDAATPLIAERHSANVPPHAAHLPERYGLFTIILLGEAVVRVMHGMESQAGWSVAAATCAAGGFVVAFALWWWYFDGVRGAEERHVRSGRDALRLQVWSYAHLPMYLGIALTGVGLEHAITVAQHEVLHGAEAWLLAGSLAMVMVAITTILGTSEAARRERRLARTVGPHYALAGATAAGAALAGHVAPPALIVLLAGSSLLQALLAMRVGKRRLLNEGAGEPDAGPLSVVN